MINPPNPRIEQVFKKKEWERSTDYFHSSTDEDPPLSLLIDVQDYSDTLQRDLLSNFVGSGDTPDMDILPPSPPSNGLASSINYIENWFDMSPSEQEQLRLAQANSDTDIRVTTENFGFKPLLDLVAWSDPEQGQTVAPSSSQEWSNESYSIFGATPPAHNRCRTEYFREHLKEVCASSGRDGSKERGSTHNQVA
ncbi:hypothetical protein B0O99DRAFT_629865 [Bisporella sp. PMI_857]|nr:hypothetical protein B0O99DRAFT_629865 [Bisporella sp. PMI_857]